MGKNHEVYILLNKMNNLIDKLKDSNHSYLLNQMAQSKIVIANFYFYSKK